jgi:heptose I phosphotransferase
LAGPFDITAAGNLLINETFRHVLRQNGLETFEAFMECKHGKVVKQAVRERSTVRLLLADGNSESAFFLKRHWAPPWKEYLKHLAGFSWPSSALNEWRAILRFHEMRLPTMIPVAAGQKRDRLGLVNQSFVLTREIKNAERLDGYLARWSGAPLTRRKIRKKRMLTDRLASLTRMMHASGLNHRDYYLCHVFIREGEQEKDFELFVLDLHRVDIRRSVGRRWVVKDLAALNYSSRNLPVNVTDRVRFLTVYLRKNRLGKEDLVWVRQILRKTRKIARHTKKL